jgi:hypothetical protein
MPQHKTRPKRGLVVLCSALSYPIIFTVATFAQNIKSLAAGQMRHAAEPGDTDHGYPSRKILTAIGNAKRPQSAAVSCCTEISEIANATSSA